MSASLLSLSSLSVEHTDGAGRRRPLLQNVGFDLAEGRTLALVGESGSGKSMTALAMMGLLPEGVRRSEGTAFFEGQDLCQLRDEAMARVRGREMAMVFQEPHGALNPVHPIGGQVAEGLRIHRGLGRRAAWDGAEKVLNDIGFPATRQRMQAYPHELSGGMRQRVLLAMALVCEPRVLLLDEPTTALDVTLQRRLVKLLRTLQERSGMAMLWITHDLQLLPQVADDAVVMYAGSIVERGSSAALLERPRHPYTRALVNAMAFGREPKKPLVSIDGEPPRRGWMSPGCPFEPRCKQAVDRCAKGARPPLHESLACHNP